MLGLAVIHCSMCLPVWHGARNLEKRCAEFPLSGRMRSVKVQHNLNQRRQAVMHDLQVIRHEAPAQESARGLPGGVRLAVQWIVGSILAFLIGSWLVWWAVNLQRQFAEDEIRSACQRVMPETVQRCVDTVIIQRGGARR